MIVGVGDVKCRAGAVDRNAAWPVEASLQRIRIIDECRTRDRAGQRGDSTIKWDLSNHVIVRVRDIRVAVAIDRDSIRTKKPRGGSRNSEVLRKRRDGHGDNREKGHEPARPARAMMYGHSDTEGGALHYHLISGRRGWRGVAETSCKNLPGFSR